VSVHRLEPPARATTRRPKAVTLLAWGVLSIVIINLVGFIEIVSSWSFLITILPFSPAWIGLLRVIFIILGVAIAWGLWTGQTWAPIFTRLVTVLMAILSWINRLVLGSNTDQQSNILFPIMMTILLIALAFFILNTTQAKTFFGASHERSKTTRPKY
jgi:hypothetical protein